MFEGLSVAMVTPFRGRALDLDATARLIDFLVDGGTETIVISGSTGEAATCTVEERHALWKFAKQQLRGRIPLVAGTGTNATADSIVLTRMAEDLGLDGVMLVFTHKDVPGIIGKVGTSFGKHGVNIAQMTVGRAQPGGEAVGILNLDNTPSAEALKEVSDHPAITSVKVIELPPAGFLPAWLLGTSAG